jgi:Domain of unknown function (DUF3786)
LTSNAFSPQPRPGHLPLRVEELRRELKSYTPLTFSIRTQAQYTPISDNHGEFILPIWGRQVRIPWPGLVALDPETGGELSVDQQALLLYHFHTSDGTPLAGRWISFSELPGGGFYAQAFQGYSGNELSRTFGEDTTSLERAALAAGGSPERFADLAFSFPLFPRLHLLVAYWQGDEDFPGSLRILFDAAAEHHLPMDVCAIAGGMLTRRILKAYRQGSS